MTKSKFRRKTADRPVKRIPPSSQEARDEGPRLIPLPEARHADLSGLPRDTYVSLADHALELGASLHAATRAAVTAGKPAIMGATQEAVRASGGATAREDAKTLEMYGAKVGGSSFANNCLLARRLVERGVRVVQLFDAD